MAKYRKKPIIIEAEQFLKDKLPYPEGIYVAGSYCSTQEAGEWCELHQLHHLMPHYKIDTLEGSHVVSHRDWIITGVKGGKYPVKNDIFLETYERGD